MCSYHEIIIKPIQRLCSRMIPIIKRERTILVTLFILILSTFFFFFDTRVYDDQNNILPYGDKNNK